MYTLELHPYSDDLIYTEGNLRKELGSFYGEEKTIWFTNGWVLKAGFLVDGNTAGWSIRVIERPNEGGFKHITNRNNPDDDAVRLTAPEPFELSNPNIATH